MIPFPAKAVLLLLASALSPGQARLPAQARPPTDTLGPLVLERTVRDRWILGAQHPQFVPFETFTEGITLELVRTPTLTPSKLLRLEPWGTGIRARLFLEEDHRLDSMLLDLPPFRVSPAAAEDRRVEERRGRLRGRPGAMNLPEARFWEVPFVLSSRPLVPGTTWTDTLSFLADPGEGLSQSLRLIRRVEVVGDTVLDRGRYPLLLTSARAEYRSVDPRRDAALQGDAVVEVGVEGTVRGWAVVDTLLGVRALGLDSLAWAGTATLRIPDGRSFSTPVRYEAVRTWTLREPEEWAAIRDSARARLERDLPGLLPLPHLPLEERLAAGDRPLADSLLAAWRGSSDPNERQELVRLLARWGKGSGFPLAALRSRLVRERLELGDTAGAVGEVLQWRSEPWTLAEVELVLPYLDDPGRLWRLGVDPSEAYAQLASDLLRSSPLFVSDPSRWRCVPEACERLLALGRTAQEPLLRDAALVGLFARDPETWRGRLEERARQGSHLAAGALNQAALALAAGPRGGQLAPEELARELLEAGPDRAPSLARRVPELFLAVRAQEAPPEVVSELLAAALDSVAAKGSLPWPYLPALGLRHAGARPAASAEPGPRASGPRFLVDDGLPPELLRRVPQGLPVLAPEEVQAWPLRRGAAFLRLRKVEVVGPFVCLGWEWTVLEDRPPEYAPRGHWRGEVLYLVKTADGWRVVDQMTLVT